MPLTGTAPGPYALLWPATDVWPGPEMDLVERLNGGALYATLHWDSDPRRESNADNAFTSIGLDGIDGSARHTYQYLWEPGRLTVRAVQRCAASWVRPRRNRSGQSGSGGREVGFPDRHNSDS